MVLFTSPIQTHGELTGVTADQHHAQAHAANHLRSGNDGLNIGFAFQTRQRKATTQTVNNSTTLVNDADLGFSVTIARRYYFDVHFAFSGSAAAGIRVAVLLPGGGTLGARVLVVGETGYQDSGELTASGTPLVLATADTAFQVHIFGYLVPSASGTVNIQWAQGTAIAIDTIAAQWSYSIRTEDL